MSGNKLFNIMIHGKQHKTQSFAIMCHKFILK